MALPQSIENSNGPPTPSYIFRGHTTAIHALHFFARNTFLASGDADGNIVIWRLVTKRPAAVWKAHEGGIMGVKDWTGDRLITHGRDHKLRVWQVRGEDFTRLNTKLPADATGTTAIQSEKSDDEKPWLLHSMDVNALNFCAFATSRNPDTTISSDTQSDASSLLIAAPNGLDSGGIDIFHLPSQVRVSKLGSDPKVNTGMVMTVRLVVHATSTALTLIAGYEDGQVAVYRRRDSATTPVWAWDRILLSRPHIQPVLSLDVMPDSTAFITSSADATIAKFAMPSTNKGEVRPEKNLETKHAGQQDLKIRSDGRVFATAGWDKRVRVYSTKLKELAVLKWHQEGCYAIAFAEIDPANEAADEQSLLKLSTIDKLKKDRDAKVTTTHWLAAGSKDGKISLWDVY